MAKADSLAEVSQRQAQRVAALEMQVRWGPWSANLILHVVAYSQPSPIAFLFMAHSSGWVGWFVAPSSGWVGWFVAHSWGWVGWFVAHSSGSEMAGQTPKTVETLSLLGSNNILVNDNPTTY